jgi:hypothetical protein
MYDMRHRDFWERSLVSGVVQNIDVSSCSAIGPLCVLARMNATCWVLSLGHVDPSDCHHHPPPSSLATYEPRPGWEEIDKLASYVLFCQSGVK